MVREMKIVGVVMDKESDSSIVLLKDVKTDAILPIVIDLLDATNIAIKLENIALPRPMTHDLLENIMNQLGVEVERVEISDLINDTFYALVYLSVNDREKRIDARPSDALTIALRTGSRIFVKERVLAKYKTVSTKKGSEAVEKKAEKWADILTKMEPEDFPNYDLRD